MNAGEAPVYGVCFGCGAVAWELLRGVSDYCLGCDPGAYRDDEDDDPCAYCNCERGECWEDFLAADTTEAPYSYLNRGTE